MISCRLLAIESSCDETAAAVVEGGRVILSNAVASQADLHAQFGGVFPEVASRQHIRSIYPI
ncbi:tRNA (adenosine(37)-N6)-threonylcarbamoyltransferase complex transferase subunit TsaD, partial [Candidatus Parcubacteria bacterium]